MNATRGVRYREVIGYDFVKGHKLHLEAIALLAELRAENKANTDSVKVKRKKAKQV